MISKDIPICDAADPNPLPAKFELPRLACDCHSHIFAPLSEFPMVEDRLYTPPPASLNAYNHLLETYGFERAVIVQPSVYGTDNRVTMNTVASDPDRFRAVIVTDGDITSDAIREFHAKGARGVRANLLFSGEKAMADVRKIAEKIAPFNWHLQVLLDVSTFPNLFEFFANLPVETVFDHMGHSNISNSADHQGFQEMLQLINEDKAWAKLSGAYRISNLDKPPFTDIDVFAKAILDANSNRAVFGTDWPHPHFNKDMPNDGPLMDQIMDWTDGDPLLIKKLLANNPAKLYDF